MEKYTTQELTGKLINQLKMELHSYQKSAESLNRNITKLMNDGLNESKRYNTMKLNLQEMDFLISWTNKQISELAK